MAKKRHHYVPIAYLKSFCDVDGMLHIYRKDDPEKEIRLAPDNTGFHKYYYSQPTPEGDYDHDKIEDCFCEYESKWPGIVERFRAKENVNDVLDTIYAFIGLQRARVPATRDACEKILADGVKYFTRQMDAAGKLPPPPKGFENILDQVDVAIDPHQSIHAMVSIIRGVGKLLDKIGLEVVHNDTNIPFVTSDNPVIWFDPLLPDDEMRPYSVDLNGTIVLMFPVAPDLLIYGDTSKREQFTRHGMVYSTPNGVSMVEWMNTLTCRFAYESVYSSKSGIGNLVKKHANVSPVIQSETIPTPNGQFFHSQFVWGQRTRKTKWEPRSL